MKRLIKKLESGDRISVVCQLLLALGATTMLALSGCSVLQSRGDASPDHNGMERSVYASTGLGASRLNPDKSGIPSWSVSDKVNAAGQITVGADINRHFSLELHSADLGSAGVEKFAGSQRGRINYHMHGGSALWYAGKNRHKNKRAGITGFGRAGIGKMHNSSVGNAPYTQRNSTQLLVGAGLEYSTKIGVGLRAELITFDSDAQYAQLGLIFRHGRKPRQEPVYTPEPVAEAVPEKVEVTPPPLAVQVAPLDSDGDGVVDNLDRCSSTTASVLVDEKGCAVFDGVLEGVNFYSASEQLTPTAQTILDGVARTLKQYPKARINVNAHTDASGSESYNQNLSIKRANSVVEYLSRKGVNRRLLVPKAFGESRPIANNGTEEGRARNRRVELQVVK